jgi:ABC-2 type transport system ATP-binding protein
MNEAIIHIRQLAKQYKDSDFYAVHPMDLTIRNSEIFGLLGPNAAGKTTLISLICGLLKPTSGSIEIDGLNYQQNKREIQFLIGVVPQEYALYPTLTAFENLMYFGAMFGLKGKHLKNKIQSSLQELGLLKFADKKVKTFSGGMKRRLNLLAGILHDPRILFLDEPTVGVDVQSKNVIIEHLRKMNAKGTTIIYTSHHMMEAQYFCNRVAIIDSGKIIAKGTPKELITTVENASRLEDVYLSLTGGDLRDYL